MGTSVVTDLCRFRFFFGFVSFLVVPVSALPDRPLSLPVWSSGLPTESENRTCHSLYATGAHFWKIASQETNLSLLITTYSLYVAGAGFRNMSPSLETNLTSLINWQQLFSMLKINSVFKIFQETAARLQHSLTFHKTAESFFPTKIKLSFVEWPKKINIIF